jgi:hypothetical protein
MYICSCMCVCVEGVTHKFVNRDFIGWFIRNSQCVCAMCAIVCNCVQCVHPTPFLKCAAYLDRSCAFYRVLDPFVLDRFVLDPFILSQIHGFFKYLYPVTQLSASHVFNEKRRIPTRFVQRLHSNHN